MNIYFIKNSSGHIKIGVSDDPLKRLSTLQTSNSSILTLLYTSKCESREEAFEIEHKLHVMLESYKILGEWFNLPDQWEEKLPKYIVLVPFSYEASIKNLTSRCNMIDLLTVMANVCKSSKDIATFNKLLDLANGDNALEFDSVTSLAAQLEMPRPTLSLMLSALVREQFLYKETTKKYSINPFMFTGKRVRSNEQRENLQSQWKNKQRE
jgi:predicted GIY-YIG superfamily endonuclease